MENLSLISHVFFVQSFGADAHVPNLFPLYSHLLLLFPGGVIKP